MRSFSTFLLLFICLRGIKFILQNKKQCDKTAIFTLMAPNMKYWTSIDRFFWSKSLYLITGQFYRPNLNSGLLCTIKAIKNFPQSELDEGFFPHCPGGLWYMKIRGQVEKSRENSFLIICLRPATKIKILLEIRTIVSNFSASRW